MQARLVTLVTMVTARKASMSALFIDRGSETLQVVKSYRSEFLPMTIAHQTIKRWTCLAKRQLREAFLPFFGSCNRLRRLLRWLTYTKPPMLCTRHLVRILLPLSLLHNVMQSCVSTPPSSRPRTDTQSTSVFISEEYLTRAESVAPVDSITLSYMLAYDPDHVYVRLTTSDNDCILACALEAEERAP